MKKNIHANLRELALLPGLSGHEDRVRRTIAARLGAMGIASDTDRLGNLSAHFPGTGPSVLLFTHMDQLGFVVRRIEPDGFIRLERLGGVPERALPAQQVLICVGEGRDVPAIIANKSHHATTPEEKTTVRTCAQLHVDAGFASAEEARKAGVRVGSPVVYAPAFLSLAGNRVSGTSLDDRAGCAVLLEVARALKSRSEGPPVHLVFSVQEEFNLRGVLPAARAIGPDMAIQVDIALSGDSPDMAGQSDIRLGGGPVLSLYSFHGRGTLNGVIPHPAMVALLEHAASHNDIPLQRSARTGLLTDLSYVQLQGEGVACADMAFPARYSHSAREVVDLDDLCDLARLLLGALEAVRPDFSLNRDDYT